MQLSLIISYFTEDVILVGYLRLCTYVDADILASTWQTPGLLPDNPTIPPIVLGTRRLSNTTKFPSPKKCVGFFPRLDTCIITGSTTDTLHALAIG